MTMPFYIKSIRPFLFLFFYVYPQFLVGIPLSTRILFSVFGFFLFLYSRYFSLSFFKIFQGAGVIAFVSICTALLNKTFDFFFVFYVVSMLLIYFAAYFFTLSFPKLIVDENNLNHIIYLFVLVVMIQSFFAILMYVFPTLNDLLNAIFPMQSTEQQDSLEGMRLMGIGIAFFGAGVINGLALIAIVYLYLAKYLKNALLWVGIYIFVFLIGMMMARTTVVGFGMSMLFLLFWKPLYVSVLKNKFKWLFLMGIVLFLSIVLVFVVVDERLLMFAFEFFYNLDTTGSFESASTNRLQEMYVYPSRLKTWLIGDGLYNLPDGHYYMSTDVGFLRLLYYGGIPMIAAYYYFSWYTIRQIRKIGIPVLLWKFLLFSFFYLVVLGSKGLADINFLFLLLYACCYQQKKLLGVK